MNAIEVVDVRKRYESLRVLEGLTLRVEEGEVYGLLGPNGAGKSTLIHLLLGFLRADGGQIRVLGTSPRSALRRLGYLPERVRYHEHFTPSEYLHTLGALTDLHGRPLADRCGSVLQLTNLEGAANRRLGVFSKGMLQRVGIAQALIHEPELLLIDEPTSGLDPAGQREMIDLLVALRAQGHTILMCSHQLPEVERLCDRVGILSGNRLAAEARVRDLVATAGVRMVPRSGRLPEAVGQELRTLGPAVQVDDREVRVGNDDALQSRALRILLDGGVAIGEVTPMASGVEQMYLRVTQGKGSPATVRTAAVEREVGGEASLLGGRK